MCQDILGIHAFCSNSVYAIYLEQHLPEYNFDTLLSFCCTSLNKSKSAVIGVVLQLISILSTGIRVVLLLACIIPCRHYCNLCIEKQLLLPLPLIMHSPHISLRNHSTGVNLVQGISPASQFTTGVKFVISFGYLFAMAVCGFIIVALGSTLTGLASNVGYSVYDIGTVFVARGMGCILGTIASSILYTKFSGNTIITITVLFAAVILAWLPYCTSLLLLHIAFFLLGLITAVTETGSQIMMVKFHQDDAGPWVGANSTAFCVSGIIVPAVQLATSNIHYEYMVYAVCVALSGVWLLLSPDPEKNGRIQPRRPDSVSAISEHYWVEVIIGLMIFLMIGGGESITFYLKPYVHDTVAIDPAHDSLIFLVFFLWVTIGKVLGIVDQNTLTNTTIVSHFALLLLGSVCGLALIYIYPESGWVLWAGISLFGLCQGPAIGYCFDLCNRFSNASELSMSILMLGLNLGVTVVPYLASLYWSTYAGPIAVIEVGLLCMMLCIPLLYCAKLFSYVTANSYSSIPDIL